MKNTKAHAIKTLPGRYEKWEVLTVLKKPPTKVNPKTIIGILLENRGIKSTSDKAQFFDPRRPDEIKIEELGINAKEVKKAIKRIQQAKERKEKVIVYGDYDADGICATAIAWETLYGLGLDVIPYIPERFSEGYGLNAESLKKLKKVYPKLKLIVTVDNGIVANDAVVVANKLAIDVIITDHHQPGEKYPECYSLIHTDKICGSAISWIFSREVLKVLDKSKLKKEDQGLELAAIGTVADQMPLVGLNRSFARYGIENLKNTERFGLLELFKSAAVTKDATGWKIGTYEINYVIAPRINAMGRLSHAIESLRLLCTKNVTKAHELAQLLNKTNLERQKIVEEVVAQARNQLAKMELKTAIVIADGAYHEGVIGLAAGRLVEEFYRPTIVISQGEKMSKASARSISGFNIIQSIRKLKHLIEAGGGHPMAAGFSIKTENIREFTDKFIKNSEAQLLKDALVPKLKLDVEIDFMAINIGLYNSISSFSPTGLSNPTPSFLTKNVTISDAKTVGQEGKHLKLKLEKNGIIFDTIGFGLGEYVTHLHYGNKIDIAYTLDKNVWNGYENLQLKLKDIKIPSS